MDVFVYGTLTDPGRVDALLDDWAFGPDAVLRGAHRVDGRYPTLAPGGETEGRVLRTPERDALDRYEGVDRGLYRRVSVPRRAGTGGGVGSETAADDAVQVYVGDPVELAVDDAADPPDGPPSLAALADFISGRCTVVLTRE